METVLGFDDPFTWLFYVTVMIGTGMAVFANGGKAFLGIFILFMNALILQTELQERADIAYLYEQFGQGEPIECAVWRGTRTIADPAKGWVLDQGRFVKDDTVLSDPGLCRVSGKEFPEYVGLEPLIFFLMLTGFALLARLGVRSQEGRSYWLGEKRPNDMKEDAFSEAEEK